MVADCAGNGNLKILLIEYQCSCGGCQAYFAAGYLQREIQAGVGLPGQAGLADGNCLLEAVVDIRCKPKYYDIPYIHGVIHHIRNFFRKLISPPRADKYLFIARS